MLASPGPGRYRKEIRAPQVTISLPSRVEKTDMHFTDPPKSTAAPSPVLRSGWSTLGELNGYHWFVFAAVSMAWVLDCMDQQLFTVTRNTAVTELLGPSATL